MASASKCTNSARILGDHTIGDFLKELNVDAILGLPSTFTTVSTLTTLAIEMNPSGQESIMILGCLNTVLEPCMREETGRDLENGLGKIQKIFDLYLAGDHDLYLCPLLGRSTDRINKATQKMEQRVQVGLVIVKNKFIIFIFELLI